MQVKRTFRDLGTASCRRVELVERAASSGGNEHLFEPEEGTFAMDHMSRPVLIQRGSSQYGSDASVKILEFLNYNRRLPLFESGGKRSESSARETSGPDALETTNGMFCGIDKLRGVTRRVL